MRNPPSIKKILLTFIAAGLLLSALGIVAAYNGMAVFKQALNVATSTFTLQRIQLNVELMQAALKSSLSQLAVGRVDGKNTGFYRSLKEFQTKSDAIDVALKTSALPAEAKPITREHASLPALATAYTPAAETFSNSSREQGDGTERLAHC